MAYKIKVEKKINKKTNSVKLFFSKRSRIEFWDFLRFLFTKEGGYSAEISREMEESSLGMVSITIRSRLTA